MFSRRVDGQTHTFGVSGMLRGSNLVMYDHQTETWWQQFTGESLVGELAGKRLEFIPTRMVSWAEAREAFPRVSVLSRDTGHDRPYGTNPYLKYDDFIGPKSAFLSALPDSRLPPIERVVALSVGGVDVAYPFTLLRKHHVVNDMVADQKVAVFYTADTLSPLTEETVADGPPIGATGAFRPVAGELTLSFRYDGEHIVDEQTGSQWNVLGQAISGPLEGEHLAPLLHTDAFWFAWAAFSPDTQIYSDGS